VSHSVAGVFASDEHGVDPVRLTGWVRGRVQGVGMRWWIRARALELGLTGWALNLDDGRVEIVAEGPREHCRQLADLLVTDLLVADLLVTDLLVADLPLAGPLEPRRPGQIDGFVLRLSPARGAGESFLER